MKKNKEKLICDEPNIQDPDSFDEEFSDGSGINPLSDDELRLIKAVKKNEPDRSKLPPHDNSDLAKAKRYAKKNLVSVIFVILTIVMLAAVILILGIILFKSIKALPSKDDYKVTLGDEEYTLSYKDSDRDGTFYFDVRKIADYGGLIVSGGEGRLKISCPDGTYVRFEHGNDTATVNGVRVHVNGKVEITEKTEKSEGECLVPFSFIQKLFSFEKENGAPGIRIKFSNEDNTIIIRKVTIRETGEALPISFSPDCFNIAEDMAMKNDKANDPDLAFACVNATLLVNKHNPLGADYAPEGLLSLNEMGCPVASGREFKLDPIAAKALIKMLGDLHAAIAEKDGIVVTSAYRSYEYQVKIFNKYVTNLMERNGLSYDQAIAEVTKTSARPGESEHQSALCVDLIEKDKINLDVSFENTAAFAWLSQNASRYGYILRYPNDKVELTGYDYEPWHYRFVGIDAARTIYEDKICLEEYLAKY